MAVVKYVPPGKGERLKRFRLRDIHQLQQTGGIFLMNCWRKQTQRAQRGPDACRITLTKLAVSALYHHAAATLFSARVIRPRH